MKRMIKYLIQGIACFLPPFLKIFLWRCLGFKIGKRVKVGMFNLILVDYLELGDDACLDPFIIILFLEEFKLGNKSRIAVFTKIYGKGKFHAETRCLVSVQCLIECSPESRITMEDYSCFGPRNTVYTHGIYLPRLQGYPFKRGDVTIGEYSWTGMATTILPQTCIGRNTVITPGAVLSGTIPENTFIKSPTYHYEAKPIQAKLRKYTSQEIFTYIKNVIAKVTLEDYDIPEFKSDNLSHVSEIFFQELPISPPKKYKGKKLHFFSKTLEINQKEESIIIGYELPESIRNNRHLLWLDFKDYMAYSESDEVVLDIVNRLFSELSFKFLFVDENLR